LDKEIPELNEYNANSSFILRLHAQLCGKMQLNHWMHRIGFWHLEVDHVSITSLETNWLGIAQGLYRGMQKSPKMFEVSQAGGLQFVNGIFEYAGVMHYS